MNFYIKCFKLLVIFVYPSKNTRIEYSLKKQQSPKLALSIKGIFHKETKVSRWSKDKQRHFCINFCRPFKVNIFLYFLQTEDVSCVNNIG